ncbi:hypothetical protein N7468_006578 [Penicillium chermesinum]|uniref:MARVEL domain-containing protein n=1 Tax=Penicillium chermesinum TaxID=63820 RepID=A0A9W9NUX2_9EURO|nr:uncharacterized protein N7468_006578 [Penicillium chermesinum]KAJ5225353.1 hypothetical protein N7468_006578 [Penicillium chermesinum]KAJ6161421.1 hypothetical protein N7470_004817 [Penicillium chermesinum]
MLRWVYPVRIIQAIFALAVIGLTAYVVATIPFSNVIYFMLFNGCWTAAIAVPYLGLAPVFSPTVSHELVIPGMEIITSCLWLASWIAVAVLIPKPSECHMSSCHSAQAVIVLAAVEWALFIFTNYFAILDLRNSRNNRHKRAQNEATQRETTQVEAADASQTV